MFDGFGIESDEPMVFMLVELDNINISLLIIFASARSVTVLHTDHRAFGKSAWWG